MRISMFLYLCMVIVLLFFIQCNYLKGEENRYFGNGKDKAIASAAIRGVLSNTIMGTIYFSEEKDKGLKISGEIAGLLAGNTYGLHVLDVNSCDTPELKYKDFDPGKSNHHGNPWDSPGLHHAGDLPNIKAGGNGKAKLSIFTSNIDVSDSSAFSVLNHAIALFSNADDYQSQPNGNVKERIACGVIVRTVTKSSSAESSSKNPKGIKKFDL